jgi:hypothetical protein
MGKAKRKSDPFAQRPGETWLQWQSRIALARDLEQAAKQPLITPEAERHGQYENGHTEVDCQRVAVKVNRGGSTIQRWMNEPEDRDHPNAFTDNERAAIRYCQKLWAWIDYHGAGVVFVDNGMDGMAEHEALAELAQIKRRVPPRYWDTYENICRFEMSATGRNTRTIVAFVASLIAMWRNL